MFTFRQLFDATTGTYTYLVADLTVKKAAIFDTVMRQLDRDLSLIAELGVELAYCFETHLHADHISAAHLFRESSGCQIVVPDGSGIVDADYYILDQEVISIGDIQIKALSTPGHSDAHMAYCINDDTVLTGDALNIRGCGRTDERQGNPGVLWDSVHDKLFTLPDETRVFPGHDFQGRVISTIGEERLHNPRLVHKNRSQFIQFMQSLDLPFPKKMDWIVKVNRQCGLWDG